VKKALEIAANHGPAAITLHILSDFRQRDWSGPEGNPCKKPWCT